MKRYLLDALFIGSLVFVIISGTGLIKTIENHSERLDKIEAMNIELAKQALYEHDLLDAFLQLMQQKSGK